MHITIKLLRKSFFTFLANERFELIVHLLNMLAHVAALSKLFVASSKRARERSIFSVQAHMVDELGSIGKYVVAVASELALEKSRAADVAVVRPAEAEYGEGLAAREHLMII